MRTTSRNLLCLFLFAAAACAADSTEGTGSTGDAIQTSNLPYVWVAPYGVGADDDAQHATGTVFAAYRDASGRQQYTADGTAIRFSCGITFISPQYAITAGHCVASDSVIDTNRDLVTVQMYKPQQSVPYEQGDVLSGAWSTGITHGRIAGYDSMVDRFQCRVVARCADLSGNDAQINCNDPTGDVALVRCDTPVTAKGYRYLSVAQTDNPNVEAYMRWTHEIYQDPPAGTALAADFLNHYSIRGAYANNLHYFGAKNGVEYNQLVQLSSKDWQFGDLFWSPKKLSPVTDDVVWTDVPGCHGSSGSGMLQYNFATNKYELLGPISLGQHFTNTASNDLLCHDRSVVEERMPLIAYTSLAHVQRIAALADDCRWYGNWFPNNTCHAACGTQNPDGCLPGLVCQNNACVCIPKTCASLGDDCGTVSDGCGHTLHCGTCTSPLSCTANVCTFPLHCPAGMVSCGDHCVKNARDCW